MMHLDQITIAMLIAWTVFVIVACALFVLLADPESPVPPRFQIRRSRGAALVGFVLLLAVAAWGVA